jgi:uncharacterized membrane protein
MVMLVASLYDWLMFFHIVAAMVWVGGLVTLSLLATQALRGEQPDNVARFVRSLRLIGPLFGPAMVLVLGLGIWMVIDSDAWTFGQGWVRLALGLFAAAFVVGALFQSRAAILAQRAVDAGDQGEATASSVAGYGGCA